MLWREHSGDWQKGLRLSTSSAKAEVPRSRNIGDDGHDVTLNGHGIFVSLDGAGNLILTYNAGTDDAVTIQTAPATVESVITHATRLIGIQMAHSQVRIRCSREFRLLRSLKLKSAPTSTPAMMS
jgi:hypothetical protein